MDKYDTVTNFDELIAAEHGAIGTESRKDYQIESRKFIVIEMKKIQGRI